MSRLWVQSQSSARPVVVPLLIIVIERGTSGVGSVNSNRTLGMMDDDPELLRRLAAYVERLDP